MHEPIVDIVLATRDGASFLEAQLVSIERQTFSRWRLIARDDASSDGTQEILRAFRERHPKRTLLTDEGSVRLGLKGNFNVVLSVSTAPYTALCDQDDIWRQDKLESMVRLLQRADRRGRLPRLVHSDLEVVDSRGASLSRSMWESQKLDPRNSTLSRLLVQNVITGCATMVNRELLSLALPVPTGAIVHDWWLALVGAAVGEIHSISEPLVSYRQHDRNEIGAKSWTFGYLARRLRSMLIGWNAFSQELRACQEQATELLERLGPQLSDAQRKVMSGFVELQRRSRFRRVAFLCRHGVLKVGLLRNAAMLVRV